MRAQTAICPKQANPLTDHQYCKLRKAITIVLLLLQYIVMLIAQPGRGRWSVGLTSVDIREELKGDKARCCLLLPSLSYWDPGLVLCSVVALGLSSLCKVPIGTKP